MTEITKPNAFIFKAYIDGEYRLCVCPRINDKWSEVDITYIQNYDGCFDDTLDNELFSVIFVGYEQMQDGQGSFTLKDVNSKYLKSDTAIAREMYQNNNFFETIEEGYKIFYEQPTERQGEQTQTSQ